MLSHVALAAVLTLTIPAAARADFGFYGDGFSNARDFYRGPARIYRWTNCNWQDANGREGCLRYYADQGVEAATGRAAIRIASVSVGIPFPYTRPGGERITHTSFLSGYSYISSTGGFRVYGEDVPLPQWQPGEQIEAAVFRTPDSDSGESLLNIRLTGIFGETLQTVRYSTTYEEHQNQSFALVRPTVTMTPEPAAWALLATGLAATGVAHRRTRRTRRSPG